MKKPVEATMETVEHYMKANKLALNSDKSQVMLVSKDDEGCLLYFGHMTHQ